IRRYDPQSQSDIYRVHAQCGPEGKLTNPMLFRVAGSAQRNGVAIARLHPHTAIGSRTHMRGVRWCCFAAGYARELTDKGQVLRRLTQVGLWSTARYGAEDAGGRHWS